MRSVNDMKAVFEGEGAGYLMTDVSSELFPKVDGEALLSQPQGWYYIGPGGHLERRRHFFR